MNISQILSPQFLKELRLLIICGDLVRKSARIDLRIHDASLSVYYIVITGRVKVNTAFRPGKRHRGKHDIFIPFPHRKSDTRKDLLLI